MFVVQCPGCGNRMKYMPMKHKVAGRNKRCVYCGRYFVVHSNANSSRIVQIK